MQRPSPVGSGTDKTCPPPSGLVSGILGNRKLQAFGPFLNSDVLARQPSKSNAAASASPGQPGGRRPDK